MFCDACCACARGAQSTGAVSECAQLPWQAQPAREAHKARGVEALLDGRPLLLEAGGLNASAPARPRLRQRAGRSPGLAPDGDLRLDCGVALILLDLLALEARQEPRHLQAALARACSPSSTSGRARALGGPHGRRTEGCRRRACCSGSTAAPAPCRPRTCRAGSSWARGRSPDPAGARAGVSDGGGGRGSQGCREGEGGRGRERGRGGTFSHCDGTSAPTGHG